MPSYPPQPYTTPGTLGDTPLRRPVITSALGASRELAAWLRENSYDQVVDGDGGSWRLTVEPRRVPDRGSATGLDWQLTVRLAASVSMAELVATGVLDQVADARLMNLVDADELIELSMKPLVYNAANEDEAKLLLADLLPRIKRDFARQSLKEIKRALVGRHIDRRGAFGG